MELPERILQGVAVSPGFAVGPALLFSPGELNVPCVIISAAERAQEIVRFEAAIAATQAELEALLQVVAQRLGPEEARVFEAHRMVLEDKLLIEDTLQEHRHSGCNIEHCFKIVSHRYADALEKAEDDYLRGRVADVRDVSRRLLQRLLSGRAHPPVSLPHPGIMIAEALSPSDIAVLDKEQVLGIITTQGERTSHAAVMARSLKIPAVVRLHRALAHIEPGATLLLDGYEGTVIVNPTVETLHRYRTLRETPVCVAVSTSSFARQTTDGHAFSLMANLESVDEAVSARKGGAQGVGLFRTEGLFFREAGFPSEEVQYQAYRQVVEAFHPHPVTFRTLDLGGDKALSHPLYPRGEHNTALGLKGIRFSLAYPEIFQEQLAAILRAAIHGPVRLMLPMVSSLDEVAAVSKLLEKTHESLGSRSLPYGSVMERGIMVETPAAALLADHFARQVDFMGLGTNDLIQYTLAVDRLSDRVASLYEPHHPAVLRLIYQVAEAARLHHCPLSVCGEMAGDPFYAPLLLGLGVDTLSMAPAAMEGVRGILSRVSYRQVRALGVAVLGLSQASQIRDHLQAFYLEALRD